MRASDRDREQIAERLRHAAGEGRLFPEELEQRLRAAFAARTYGELHALVSDLPGPAALTSPTRPARPTLAGLRPVLPWLVGLAALLLILMAMVAGVAVREHASAAAPFPPSQSAAARPLP